MSQTINTTVPGPIFSDGTAITVTTAGTIDGGPTGVEALSFNITTLTNSGSILGAGRTRTGAPGGFGVLNDKTITTLKNTGTIAGGDADFSTTTLPGGAGGAAISNNGTVTTLTNTGTISGGLGGGSFGLGGSGGAGIVNAGEEPCSARSTTQSAERSKAPGGPRATRAPPTSREERAMAAEREASAFPMQARSRP